MRNYLRYWMLIKLYMMINQNILDFLKIKSKELILNNNDLKKQINNSKDEYKKMETNLISYLTMKKAEKNIKELKIKIDEKKIIII